jgi:hypothetical protein
MPSPRQSDPPVDALPTVRPADLQNYEYPNGLSSVGKRALITLVRYLIIFCIGVSATLAWLSYGDPVREVIASSYPQLGWLAPQAEPAPQNAPDVTRLATRTASSPDRQQPGTMSLDLDTVRQDIDQTATSIASSQQQIARSLDRIATSQEQMTRTVEQMMRAVEQFTAGQEQMTREITKLQEIEQSNSSRNSEPSARPASASAPKPISRPASASKPLSRASQEPTVP